MNITKHKCAFAALAVFSLAASAFAAWTVTDDGSTPVVTDGHWTIKLNNKKSAVFVSTDGATTVLDMSTLNADLAAEGKTYRCTEIAGSGFRGQNVAVLKTGLTELRLPDEVTSIGQDSFHGCSALTSVMLGTGFNKFASTHGFSQCGALATVYTRGETPVPGTVHLPDVVSSIPNYTFESCKSIVRLVACGVKSVGVSGCFENVILESVELSPEIYSVSGNGDAGAFYKCWKLFSFFPSNMVLTAAVGGSAFRELPLDHDLDFSASTFTEIQGKSFYGIKLAEGKRITLPATLKTLGSQAFQQQQNSRTSIVRLRFLGEAPTSLGTYALEPRNSGSHNVFYVDAKKCPSWTTSGFTSVEDDPSLPSQSSYPGPKTLGKSTLGVTNSGWWNWLVQEDLPKGPTYWEVVGTDGAGVVTIASTNGYWTLSLTPNGTGAYLARCLSATAPAAEALDLGQIEDDTDLPLAGLAEGAFANCQKLSGVTLPTGANALGAHAFSNCTALASAILPGTFSWNDAGPGAFEGCSALERLGLASQDVVARKLVLPAEATTLADALFAGCAQFTSFAGPGVTSLGARVFDGCSALAAATFVGDICALSSYGEADFRGTALTQTMDFSGSSISAIPASLFENSTGILHVKLPATVASVGDAAFKNLAPGASITFAGNPPDFGAAALQPPANAAGSRYIVRVEDGDALSAWKASGFTPTTPEMQSESDYLGNIYQGWTTLGAAGSSNWLLFLDSTLTWWISGRDTYSRPDNNGTVQTTVVTDGDWEMHVFVVGSVTNLAPKLCVAGGTLDMTTLDTDTGLFPSTVGYKAFCGLAAGAGPAVVRLPDSVTTLGDRCFQDNHTIEKMEVGAGFSSMGGAAPFRDANLFATFYKRGKAECVEGRVEIPEDITVLPESCFYNCDGVQEVLAPSVVSLGHSCFYQSGNVTNIVLSPDIHTIENGGNGVFYHCGNLRTISPSAMKLTKLGSDAFRELRLSHGLDFSKSTFTWLGTRAFFGFQAKGEDGTTHYPVIFPKTLATVNESAFYGYNGWSQIYVFLGDKPSFGTSALDPQGNAGRRYFLVVDANRYPAWTATDFTPLAEEDKSLSDYPKTYLRGMPGYPGGTVLGWSTISSGNYKNWLIQLRGRGFSLVVR
ncbi:MAG: leucine-rich repeat protein [Kiritimatiellae bacterium]|nr:leucine-rich repeat protein [Kiritimatiellia bacterium]